MAVRPGHPDILSHVEVRRTALDMYEGLGMRGCTDPRGEFTLKKFHNRKGGFTLIELMIVVAIIGILAAIAIPNFLRFQLKAKTSEGKTNIAAIRTAEQSYYSEFGTYVSADGAPSPYGRQARPHAHQLLSPFSAGPLNTR